MTKRRDAKEQLQAVMTAKRVSRPENTDAMEQKTNTPALKRTDSALRALAERKIKVSSNVEVVSLDSLKCLPSIISDRLDTHEDPELESLKLSIQETGQKVPILVRKHPMKEGYWQVAYGHRRVNACRELGITVKAVEQELSDEQLVIAQGQENHERKNLSFIETALFATRLSQSFPKASVIKAIGANSPAALSHYLKVTRDVPLTLIELIGPSPKIGRPSWTKLAEIFSQNPQSEGKLMTHMNLIRASQEWKDADSTEKFYIVLKETQKVLSKGKVIRGSKKTLVNSENGVPILELIQAEAGAKFNWKGDVGRAFGMYLVEHLPELVNNFDKAQREKS